MCLIRPEHFTGVVLFVYITYTTLACAASLNASEEIRNIFNGVNQTTVSLKKGTPKSGNFAEGGLLNINTSPASVTTPIKKDDPLSGHKYTLNDSSTENLHESFESRNITDYKNSTLDKLSETKNSPVTKLNDTGSNLFLGVPEVVHINGTSSIKPRKGVYYNKIVPRKGVENDSGVNRSGLDFPCVWLGENECYDSKELNDVDCDCCKEGNVLGKTIRWKYPVTCKNCKPVILDFPDERRVCDSFCCYSNFHKAPSPSNTQNGLNENVSFAPESEEQASSVYKKMSGGSEASAKSTKNLKQKPSITKVPYDVEVVTEILSKAKQKIFLPVIVSVLLLPLMGVLVFVVLRKMKEIWDKRYYKRMDFLIDGMYQD